MIWKLEPGPQDIKYKVHRTEELNNKDIVHVSGGLFD